MVTYAPSDRSLDDIVSYGMQGTNLIPHGQRGREKFVQKKIESHNKTNAIGKTNINLPPPTRLYASNTHFDGGPRDVASSFHKQTYRVKILIDVPSNALLTVAILIDMAAGAR